MYMYPAEKYKIVKNFGSKTGISILEGSLSSLVPSSLIIWLLYITCLCRHMALITEYPNDKKKLYMFFPDIGLVYN